MESRRERENEPVAILVGRWVENDVALHGTLPPFISEEKFWKEMKVNVSLPTVHDPLVAHWRTVITEQVCASAEAAHMKIPRKQSFASFCRRASPPLAMKLLIAPARNSATRSKHLILKEIHIIQSGNSEDFWNFQKC